MPCQKRRPCLILSQAFFNKIAKTQAQKYPKKLKNLKTQAKICSKNSRYRNFYLVNFFENLGKNSRFRPKTQGTETLSPKVMLKKAWFMALQFLVFATNANSKFSTDLGWKFVASVLGVNLKRGVLSTKVK